MWLVRSAPPRGHEIKKLQAFLLKIHIGGCSINVCVVGIDREHLAFSRYFWAGQERAFKCASGFFRFTKHALFCSSVHSAQMRTIQVDICC